MIRRTVIAIPLLAVLAALPGCGGGGGGGGDTGNGNGGGGGGGGGGGSTPTRATSVTLRGVVPLPDAGASATLAVTIDGVAAQQFSATTGEWSHTLANVPATGTTCEVALRIDGVAVSSRSVRVAP